MQGLQSDGTSDGNASHKTVHAPCGGPFTIENLEGVRAALPGKPINGPDIDHDVEHRALMFLMTQKTEAMLAALASTIEQERQKLGGIVINPSMAGTVDALREGAIAVPDNDKTIYDQVLPMAHQGMAVSAISRKLHLPEARHR